MPLAIYWSAVSSQVVVAKAMEDACRGSSNDDPGVEGADGEKDTAHQAAVAATTLEGGHRVMRSHVTFFDRTSEVFELGNLLPRLPHEVQVIELEREAGTRGGRMREFRVSRVKVEAALRWLVRHNPAYRDIEISNDRLEILDGLADGQLPVRVVPRRQDEDDSGECPRGGGGDLGPAPAQHRAQQPDADGYVPTTYGGVIDGGAERSADMAARLGADADRIARVGDSEAFRASVAVDSDDEVSL